MRHRSVVVLAALATVACLLAVPAVFAQASGSSTTPSTPAAPAAEAPTPAGQLLLSRVVPFQVDQPIKLDIVVGGLRVPDLRIQRDAGSLLDSVLPPRGGQDRFSWLRYTLAAENPGTSGWTLRARIRLLDKAGAIIDEFEYGKRVGAGRAKPVDFRRLTLNYAVPMIDRVEVTLSAER